MELKFKLMFGALAGVVVLLLVAMLSYHPPQCRADQIRVSGVGPNGPLTICITYQTPGGAQ